MAVQCSTLLLELQCITEAGQGRAGMLQHTASSQPSFAALAAISPAEHAALLLSMGRKRVDLSVEVKLRMALAMLEKMDSGCSSKVWAKWAQATFELPAFTLKRICQWAQSTFELPASRLNELHRLVQATVGKSSMRIAVISCVHRMSIAFTYH